MDIGERLALVRVICLKLTIIRHRGRLAGRLWVLSLLGFGLAGIASIACFRGATAGTRLQPCVPSLLHLAGIAANACFMRATAGTRPYVGKHYVRAFLPSTNARIFLALLTTERRLTFAGCGTVVVLGRRATTRRIKRSERFLVV